MANKNIQSKYGHTVLVSHTVARTRNNLSVMRIKATCGKTTEKHNITVGAVDGPRPKPPTTEELQKILDEKRQFVADEASWKEGVREALNKVE